MDKPVTNITDYLWVEKYRPKTINDCVLPEAIKKTFSEMVAQGEMQNLLLVGSAGCGKTSVAKALCNELDAEWLMINCSEDGNIDTLRTKIRNFASTVSMTGGKKVVLLDEFDYSNAQSTQPALRGFIEEFSKNCRFILTCNFKNRIIEPLHSRCTNINFSFNEKDKMKMGADFMNRAKYILSTEGIEYDEKVLVKLIVKYIPDFRRVINELQRYSVAGCIDVGVLSEIGDLNLEQLMKSMKEKDFTKVRKWAFDNIDNDQTEIFRKIYDSLYKFLEPQTIPSAILTIGDYQYKSAFVADQEINLTACLVQLMVDCEFK